MKSSTYSLDRSEYWVSRSDAIGSSQGTHFPFTMALYKSCLKWLQETSGSFLQPWDKHHEQKILYNLSTIVTLFLAIHSSKYELRIENPFRIDEGIVKDSRIRHISVKKIYPRNRSNVLIFADYSIDVHFTNTSLAGGLSNRNHMSGRSKSNFPAEKFFK